MTIVTAVAFASRLIVWVQSVHCHWMADEEGECDLVASLVVSFSAVPIWFCLTT